MEEVDEDVAGVGENGVHHGIWEAANWSGGVIKTQLLVDVNLCEVVVFVEHYHFELAIIQVSNIIQNAKFIL